MVQAEQDTDLPRSASNVLGQVQSHPCLTKCVGGGGGGGASGSASGQVNFRGSFPHSETDEQQNIL